MLAGCTGTHWPTENPEPKVSYRITAEATPNTPGEFLSAEGRIHFQLTDATRPCIPKHPISGKPKVRMAGLTPTFEMKKIGPNRFEGVAVLDQFVPTDSFGLGACVWEPTGVSVKLFNGINHHDPGVGLPLPGGAFEAGNKDFRVADGLYRGRRAYGLGVFSRDRRLPDDPPPKPGDPAPVFAGGYSDALAPIDPDRLSERYYITLTAQRIEPTP